MNLKQFFHADPIPASSKAWQIDNWMPEVLGAMKSKVIDLEDLKPVSFKNHPHAARELAVYFLDFIQERQTHSEYFFLLPSLDSLAEFFEIPHTDIQKAFHRLRIQGHESFIPGYYGNISLWSTPMLPQEDLPPRPLGTAFIHSIPAFS